MVKLQGGDFGEGWSVCRKLKHFIDSIVAIEQNRQAPKLTCINIDQHIF